MRSILAAIRSALRGCTSLFGWLWEEAVYPIVRFPFVATRAVGRVGLAAVEDILALPGKLLGGGGGGNTLPSPAAAAQDAAAKEEDRQAKADLNEDVRRQASAVRRIAGARARLEVVPREEASALPRPVLEYLQALTRDECESLAAAPSGQVRNFLAGRGHITGVRSPQEVEADLREAAAAATPAARKALIREAIQNAGRPAPAEDAEAERLLGM